MTWPTDDLSNSQTDNATDDPSQARAQINSAILKLQAILAEVDAGASVWHSGDKGDPTAPVTVPNGGTGVATIAAYNLIAGNGASAVSTLAPNTAKSTALDVLQGNGTSAMPSFEQIRFISSATAISTSLITVAHSFGATPSIVQALFECVGAEYGYSVGDRVVMSPQGVDWDDTAAAATNANTVGANATQLFCRLYTATPYILHKSSGTTVVPLTTANWRLRLAAYR